ncbi:regulator of G-protein signaling domain-containing protein [bacterium]|nr:regulator of G-protein signaling domain-containing protein [bacterium]
MSINFQPANRAELNVEIGKTSVEDLQKFTQEAEEKGGGEVRAKANKDGSYTLYVAASVKVRLSGLFAGYGASARSEKQQLAKDLVKEIVSRRLPNEQAAEDQSRTMTFNPSAPNGFENRWSDRVGAQTKALFERIDKDCGSSNLADHLRDVNEMVTTLQPRGNPATYNNVDTIMGEPAMKEALGEFMTRSLVGEVFGFMSAVQDFKAADGDANKMNLAEAIVIDRIPNPDRDQGESINISASLATQIRDTMVELRDEMAASPDRQSLSDESRRKLDGVFDVANGIMRGEEADESGMISWRITDPRKIAQFADSREFAVGLERIKDEISSSDGPRRLAKVADYAASGQLEEAVKARLPEALAEADNLAASATEQFLEIPGMHAAVESFSKAEHSSENLAFLDVTKEFESTVKGLSFGEDTAQNIDSLNEILARAGSIVNEFIRSDGNQQVNLPSGGNGYGTQNATISRFEGIAARMEFDGLEDPIDVAREIKQDLLHLFTKPEGSTEHDPRSEILGLMRRDTLMRFRVHAADEFAAVIENNLRKELASTFRDSLGG